MWYKSFVLGELSFVTMPLSCNCMKMNEIQFWNCLPKLVHCTQWQPCGVVTQDGMAQNLGFLKMSNFDIYVVLLAFGAILADPKFGSFHVGSTHHLAVTGYNELTLVVNCMNETLFIFKQYCLEGILAKESSPRTKDFLLCRDLLIFNQASSARKVQLMRITALIGKSCFSSWNASSARECRMEKNKC